MDLRIEDDGSSIWLGDLTLENGDFLPVTDADAVRQRVQTALRTFLGEWYLDVNEGLPYYQDVLVKNPNLHDLDAVFKEAILSDPQIISLDSFELDMDPAARTLSLSFSATYEDGEVIEVTEVPIP